MFLLRREALISWGSFLNITKRLLLCGQWSFRCPSTTHCIKRLICLRLKWSTCAMDRLLWHSDPLILITIFAWLSGFGWAKCPVRTFIFVLDVWLPIIKKRCMLLGRRLLKLGCCLQYSFGLQTEWGLCLIGLNNFSEVGISLWF